MRMGTRSVLFGAHQFLIHPFCVVAAWTNLYGFPTDIRLWISFFVHDIGYVGCSNIDGADGENHPERGARLMTRLFGRQWGEFTLFHSRFYARRARQQYSRLCVADKLATVLHPDWIYVPMVCLTGEIDEYMETSASKEGAAFKSIGAKVGDVWLWRKELCDFLLQWVAEHRDVPLPEPQTETPALPAC